eukprot:308760_1
MHLITLMEKLLGINVILSWILPSTLKEYNFIDKYFIKKIQLFPLTVPLNYDSQTQTASMWIDLYPMLLIYLLRRLKEYLTIHYHYNWYNRYREMYYQQINDEDRSANSMDFMDAYDPHNDDNTELEHEDNEEEFDEDLQRALLQSIEHDNSINSNET